jgi:glucose/arabinose dehydrogenase
MAVSPDWWPAGGGVLYLTESEPGRVLALPDRNGDGVADEIIQVWGSADYPHGITFAEGSLWVATNRTVVRLQDQDGDFVAERHQVIVDNLPPGGGHVSRTIAFDAASRFYVSVGSSCNVCEDDPRRAAVLRFNIDGSNETLFAAGSRNAVGITFHDGELWATENGRDRLGDDLPPEEVNILREGRHYGWPYCYADGNADYTFRGTTSGGEAIAQFCPRTGVPAVKIQAHTAPLGLRFLMDERSPAALRGDLLVALHGSWNRTVPVGHEVIRVDGLPDNPVVSTFVDFLAKGSRGFGRPVDVITGPDGAIYITDDAAGAVYRLAF